MRYAFTTVLVLFAASAIAQTTINTPTVQGRWTMAGSPYNIYNNIEVLPGSTLTIDPGVQVYLQGDYQIRVEGTLVARGTKDRPIFFNPGDTVQHWNGIWFTALTGAPDSSRFSYCTVAGVSNSYALQTYRPLDIAYATFHDNGDIVVGITYTDACVRNCTFYNNRPGDATHGGITLQATGIPGTPPTILVDSNTFYGQDSLTNVVCWFAHCHTLFTRNKLYDNTVRFDVLYAQGGSLTAQRNAVHHNTIRHTSAIYCTALNTRFEGNLICNNFNSASGCSITDGGGGIFLTSGYIGHTDTFHHVLVNNIIANNSTLYQGGALRVLETNALVYNNHIVNNTAARAGGAIDGYQARITLRNNLFYRNTTTNPLTGNPAETISLMGGDTMTSIDYNWFDKPLTVQLQGIGTSTPVRPDTLHNLWGSVSPMIAPTHAPGTGSDALLADFRLKPGAGCIGQGTTTGLSLPATDYAGNDRLAGGIDIGAYEYQTTTTGMTPVAAVMPLVVYPEPAHEVLFVQLPEAKGDLFLFNNLGQQVFRGKVADRIMRLDISMFNKGIYSLIWYNGSNIQGSKKIIAE